MKSASVVYVGPAMVGRRTSISSVLRRLGGNSDPLTLDTERSHTVSVHGHDVTLRVSAFRSSVRYLNADDPRVDDRVRRELQWLSEANGIVFVLDSQEARMPFNLHEFAQLQRDLELRSIDLADKPLVFQANKRDVPRIASMAFLGDRFRTRKSEMLESVATRDLGTVEALTRLIELVRRG